MAIRKSSPPSAALPIISEDKSVSESHNANSPPIPPRSLKRPSHGNFKESGLPYFTYHTPTSSWEDDSIEGHDSEKLAQLRRDVVNNKHVAKRGGWLRLCLLLGILSFCVIGLAVGLAFGLRNRNKSSTDDGVVPISKMTAAFPVGSYSINTYLSSITTNCTSNPATWRCYPYSTYSQSETDSAATFNWIISSDPKTPTSYFISSTLNYFSITFTNISLSLQASGTQDEHYFFETSIQKSTTPATQLASKNIAATCNFNNAVLRGYLYTKMAKTYPNKGGNSTTNSESGAYTAWPYAVMIQQVAMSGAGIPTCLDAGGNSLGDFNVAELGRVCDCSYLNTGT